MSSFAGLLAMLIYLASAALSIVNIVALWRLYEKGGAPGWGIFVPFYGEYLRFRIAGKRRWYWVQLAALVVFTIFVYAFLVELLISPVIGQTDLKYPYNMESVLDETVLSELGVADFGLLLVAGLALLVAEAAEIAACIGLGNEMRLSSGMVVGLILLPGVFYIIIGFGEKYRFRNGGMYF